MQRVTVVLGVEGVSPALTDVTALVGDMIKDHLNTTDAEGYNVRVLSAEWDEGTHEWRASQIEALGTIVDEITKKCYSSKPAKSQAIEMVEQINVVAEAVEEWAKKDEIKKSVDLSYLCDDIKARVTAVHDHLVAMAYPSRKE